MDMKATLEQVAEELNKRGIKPSHQRVKVLEYLMGHFVHPTVDMIYHEVHREVPTLSKTTVYNTLNQFLEKGLVRVINIEDNETRYDINVHDHGHFKCEACGAIHDFSVDMGGLKAEGLDGFIVSDKHVYFKGLCPACARHTH
jgi:Fur family peroxide stress response transcriptional regulator